MQKGDVSHILISFFEINHDMLNLYVWSQKFNIGISRAKLFCGGVGVVVY